MHLYHFRLRTDKGTDIDYIDYGNSFSDVRRKAKSIIAGTSRLIEIKGCKRYGKRT